MKKIVPALFLSALISLSGCGGSVSQNASSAEKSTVSSRDRYEFVDKASTELASENKNTSSNKPLSVKDFKGIWKPLSAARVADNSEAGFNEIFGSSYSQRRCQMKIDENGSFTMNMASLAEEGKNKGTFTMSSYNMIVTYSDGSPDTFLYIPTYQNKQTIKIQLGKYYIYLYKESN